MIIETRLLPNFIHGMAIWPFIFVQPSLSSHHGLIQHELVHFHEQRRWLVLPWLIAYLASRKFRLNAELRAYRKQIEVGGISLNRAASSLTRYRLGITRQQALSLLRR